MEFDLLSHIAVTRSEGILQGELVRVSGQDKRSVPKRTDALQKKGYILKEVVYQRGMRTSRLISKKFATPSTKQNDQAERGSSVRDAVRRVFDVLSQQPLVPQTTLAEALNLESTAGLPVLQKIIRRLERLKCVKRVRTATGPSATAGDLQNYVQMLHPLEPKDLEDFDTDALSLDQNIQQLSAQFESEVPVDSPALAAEYEGQTEEEQTVRHLARWNPDRLIPNVVHDAVAISGREGLTNSVGRML
jgi:transcription factor C subunit 3